MILQFTEIFFLWLDIQHKSLKLGQKDHFLTTNLSPKSNKTFTNAITVLVGRHYEANASESFCKKTLVDNGTLNASEAPIFHPPPKTKSYPEYDLYR